jgi:transcriptional regulator with XRE-family HTH domain
MTIEPKGARSAIFAEEALVVDAQSFLHRLMVEKGINRTQLANAMGVSKARVSQIFSDECKNFTVRLLARACHALGEEPRLSSQTCDALDFGEELQEQAVAINSSKNIHKLRTWSVEDWSARPKVNGDEASKDYGRALARTFDSTNRERARVTVG